MERDFHKFIKVPKWEKKITKKIRKYFELNYNENTIIYF